MEAILTGGAILIGLYAGWRMLGRSLRVMWVGIVNSFAPPLDVSVDDAPLVVAVRPRTDAPDSPDGQPSAPPVWAPTREQQLTLFRLLREYGIPREKARPALKAAGWVLSNEVWAQAAPPPPPAEDDAPYETPIAGRPTGATFHDPMLEYQPPPR